MDGMDKFVKDFKETQDHIYDRGYWAGRVPPFWPNKKYRKFLLIYAISIIAILLLVYL